MAASAAVEAILVAHTAWEEGMGDAETELERRAVDERFIQEGVKISDQFREDLMEEAGFEGRSELNVLIFNRVHGNDGWENIEARFIELVAFVRKAQSLL